MLRRSVRLLPLTSNLRAAVDSLPGPLAVAVYLLAEGTFLGALGEAVGDRGVVAAPLGVHPLLIELVLNRFDEAVGGS
jgi:hypothetical protein